MTGSVLPKKENPRGWPKRMNLVILFFTSNLICYMDRINISVTAPLIMKELKWDEASLGIILSSFFLVIPCYKYRVAGWPTDTEGKRF